MCPQHILLVQLLYQCTYLITLLFRWKRQQRITAWKTCSAVCMAAASKSIIQIIPAGMAMLLSTNKVRSCLNSWLYSNLDLPVIKQNAPVIQANSSPWPLNPALPLTSLYRMTYSCWNWPGWILKFPSLAHICEVDISCNKPSVVNRICLLDATLLSWISNLWPFSATRSSAETKNQFAYISAFKKAKHMCDYMFDYLLQ